MKRLGLVVFSALLALTLSAAAYGVPVIFFGEDLNPGFTVPPGGNAETARNAFLSGLVGVGNEDFEGFALGTTAPLNISFPGSTGSITATILGTGQVENNTGAGRFNTSPGGNRWWEATDSFSIDFSDPISAFGFYATDIGDFSGQVTLQATNGTTENFVIPNTVNGPNGSLLFWGFIDPDNSYTSIAFGNTAPGVDYFGFDDMVIGEREQIQPVIPEPSSVALYGASLLLMRWAVRRRRS